MADIVLVSCTGNSIQDNHEADSAGTGKAS